MCIILCILSRKTNTYFKKKINVKGIKKELGNLNPYTFTFLHFFITSNYKLIFFFFIPQAYWNKSATLTSDLENIYKNTLFQVLRESFHVIQTRSSSFS